MKGLKVPIFSLRIVVDVSETLRGMQPVRVHYKNLTRSGDQLFPDRLENLRFRNGSREAGLAGDRIRNPLALLMSVT